MRSLVAAALVMSGCASSSLDLEGEPNSVHERLAAGPTRLFVGRDAANAGMVTARRWSRDGWVAGDYPLVIEDGELHAWLDRDQLVVDGFDVGVGPIELPEDVFHKPAQLTDVRVTLTERATGPVTWSSDDAATARISLPLDLVWAIAIDGGKTPLGDQHLPPIEVSLALDGDGAEVHAVVELAASGTLWNWANLLELTRLELGASATTVD